MIEPSRCDAASTIEVPGTSNIFAAGIADRTTEAGRVGDLVGLLMAHADDLGDLDDADGGLQHLIHLVSRSFAATPNLLIDGSTGNTRAPLFERGRGREIRAWSSSTCIKFV
jgi:hypothetical protein